MDNFTNDSAMMIAWERHLETKRRAEALFSDPFAEALAGVKGEALSEGFGGMCKIFEFEGWPEFHKTLVIHPRAAADLQRRPRGGFVALLFKKKIRKGRFRTGTGRVARVARRPSPNNTRGVGVCWRLCPKVSGGGVGWM